MPWLLIALFGTFLGNSLNFIALSWLILQSPAGVAGLGIVVLTKFLPYLLWGRVSSSLSRGPNAAKVAIVTDLARGAIVLASYLLILAELRQAASLILLTMTFLLNSLSAVFLPSYFAAIAQLFKGETKTAVAFNGYSTVLIQLGDILGSLLAAGLLLWVSVAHLLLVDAVTYFVSGTLLMLAFRGIQNARKPAAETADPPLKEQFAELAWWKPSLFAVTFMGSAVATVVLLFNTLAPIKAQSALHDPSLFASMNAMYALGAAFGGVLIIKVAKERLKMRAIIPYGGLMVLLFPLFLFLNQAISLMGLCLCIGLINGGWGSVVKSVPLTIFPAQKVGVITNQRIIIETVIAIGVSGALIAFPKIVASINGIVVMVITLLLVAMLVLPIIKVQSLIAREDNTIEVNT